jgi:ribosomal RNA assembly protein
MPVLYVRIPDDRLGALIGPGGTTKRELEQATRTQIQIDPDDDTVTIHSAESGDPIGALKARDVVLAVGRGFSPARARRLLNDDTYLGVIDIKQVTGKQTKSALWRIRSRLIGTGGRARSRIEELSGCSMSVYGNTVSLIGKEPELERATRAVELLLRGSEHSTVFHLLVRLRADAAREEALSPLPEIPEGEG